jgi:CheY-like chemotaxis protein
MPGLNGFDALAELNRKEHDRSVVMITSTHDEELAKRVSKMGAAFLKKPFFPPTSRPCCAVTMACVRFTRATSSGAKSLLSGQIDGEFAVANAGVEIFRVARRGLFAVCRNELGKRQKQRGLRQAVAFNALVRCFRPRVLQITERQLFLLVLGKRFARRKIVCRHSHCNHAIAA